MISKHSCPYCGEYFEVSMYHPNQKVCNKTHCQRQRKADYHRQKRDSQITMKFAIAAFCVPLFIPFTVGWLPVVIRTRKLEGKNNKNTVALVLCIIGTIFTALFSIALLVFNLDMFGIAL